MSNQQIGNESAIDFPALMMALLDNNLELASKEIAARWHSSKGDHRVIILTLLCLFGAKDFNGMQALLSTLDPRFFDHTLLSSFQQLLKLASEGSAPKDKNQPFVELLERVRNLDLNDEDLGFKRSDYPILTELNGDSFWIFSDILPYLWHVVEQPISTMIPKIYAETEHYNWVKERLKVGDVAYDVGANVGLFTNMMSKRVGTSGKVLAFEPNPPVFSDLKRIVTLNQLNNVDLYPVAASNSEGVAVFNQILSGDVTREASGLALDESNRASMQSAISVTTTKLDIVVSSTMQPPSLVKIDVEGAEFQVLDGLSETLKFYRPKLVIEFHPDGSGTFDHSKMSNFLKQYSYKVEVVGKNYYCE